MKTAIIVTDATEATLSGGVHYVRPQIAWLALAMERRMSANAHKGDSWKQDTPGALLVRLYEEAGELVDACLDGTGREILDEAADVANFAWMVAAVAARSPTPRPADPGNPPKEPTDGKTHAPCA